MKAPLESNDHLAADQEATTEVIRVVGAAILQEPGARESGAGLAEIRACLVARRGPAMAESGKWEFPGGKIEPGEGPREALVREIHEELALEIAVGDWLGRGSHERNGRRIVLDVYLAHIVSGDVRLAEHDAWGWFAAQEIAGLDWAAADVPVLSALREALRGR